MKIEIKPDGTCNGTPTYTLYVNDIPTVLQESWTICDNIKTSLEHSTDDTRTECGEIAAGIRQRASHSGPVDKS